jgi:hypothetical protein
MELKNQSFPASLLGPPDPLLRAVLVYHCSFRIKYLQLRLKFRLKKVVLPFTTNLKSSHHLHRFILKQDVLPEFKSHSDSTLNFREAVIAIVFSLF